MRCTCSCSRCSSRTRAGGSCRGARRACDLVRPHSRPVRGRTGIRCRGRAGGARVRSRAAPAWDHGGRAVAQRAGARRARLRAGSSARWGRRLCPRVLRALPAGTGARAAFAARGSGRRRSRASPIGAAVVAASGNPFGAQTGGRPGAEPARRGQPQQPLGVVEGGVARLGWTSRSGGTGAGSFELVHRKFRDSRWMSASRTTCRCSSPPRPALVGLLLWGGAIAAGLLGAWRALLPGRFRGDDREAALAVGIALPAFLVHGPARLRLGLRRAVRGRLLRGRLPAVDRARADPPGPGVRLGRAVVLVTWAGLYSIAALRIADRQVDEAYSQIESGSSDAAETAKSAHSLNPLAIEPLVAWAAAEETPSWHASSPRAGSMFAAIDLQPLNRQDLVRARAVRQAGARRQCRLPARASPGARARPARMSAPSPPWDGLATTDSLERGRKRGARCGGSSVPLRRARAQAMEGRAGRALPLPRRRQPLPGLDFKGVLDHGWYWHNSKLGRAGEGRSSSTSLRSAVIR